MRQVLVTFLLAVATAWSTVFSAAAADTVSIIPAPMSVEPTGASFTLTNDVRIFADRQSHGAASFLSRRLQQSTGFAVPVSEGHSTGASPSSSIYLTTKGAKEKLGADGYELAVSPRKVTIRAKDRAGMFYGAQTFLQLLPVSIYSAHLVQGVQWTAPCVKIRDRPRFVWRGLMLDVSRHFFDKEEIKHVLDEMALHKLNVFHWHLVDDHGWRVEIKKYPRLTEIGAWRNAIGFDLKPDQSHAYGADGRYGGFYTQAEIREVVAYARDLHITVVPEIEMPGHSSAALAAYPELSCSGEPSSIPQAGGVFHGVYCAGNDKSFEFLQDVLSEIFELFPSQYVHIGGDEVPKDNWQKCPKCQARIRQLGLKDEHGLQSYFVSRIEKFINTHGHTMIGWTEIADGGLAPNAVLMDWKGGGAEAAAGGHKVIMTPNRECYLNYYQSKDRSSEPRAQTAYLPLAKVYAFDPVPASLSEQYRENILGTQGNVWTEYIPNLQLLEYMVFPRLCALSEVAWSTFKPCHADDSNNGKVPGNSVGSTASRVTANSRSATDSRHLSEFAARLKVHCQRLEQLGINYRRASLDEIAGSDSASHARAN